MPVASGASAGDGGASVDSPAISSNALKYDSVGENDVKPKSIVAPMAEFEKIRAVVMEDLCKLCASDHLSLHALRMILSSLPSLSNDNDSLQIQTALQEHPFLHKACMNENVTTEIIQCLLQQFPNAAQVGSVKFCPIGETIAFPLHLACQNQNCCIGVIELLIKKYPEALQLSCIADEGIPFFEASEFYISGLPLHYYLSREKNVDIR